MEIKIRKADEALVKGLGMDSWPVWESPVREFDWHYDDNEVCLFLEGEVTVTGGPGEACIRAGDVVVFPKGLSCRWKVTKAVKKRYYFGPVPNELK